MISWLKERERFKNNMILFIDTSGQKYEIEIEIKHNKKTVFIKQLEARFRQAEKLLPEIEKQLRKHKISKDSIKEIRVQNKGGSFTSLRIGVVTANALGLGLKIPVRSFGDNNSAKGNLKIIKPEYNSEPNIN